MEDLPETSLQEPLSNEDMKNILNTLIQDTNGLQDQFDLLYQQQQQHQTFQYNSQNLKTTATASQNVEEDRYLQTFWDARFLNEDFSSRIDFPTVSGLSGGGSNGFGDQPNQHPTISATLTEISQNEVIEQLGLKVEVHDSEGLPLQQFCNINRSDSNQNNSTKTLVEEVKDSPTCPVCGNKAGKHTYYGGRGCASCRAFFRRTVQNKSNTSFKCKSDKMCVIDSNSWKSCQSCRYDKCLKAGMKPTWVLTEKERRNRSKIREENRRKRMQEEKSQIVSIVKPPDELFTEEDYKHIDSFLQATYGHLIQSMGKYLSMNHSMYSNMLSAMYNGETVHPCHFHTVETFTLFSMQKYYSGTSDMSLLSSRDQTRLVHNNFPLCLELLKISIVDSESEGASGQDSKRRKRIELHNLIPEFKNMLRDIAKKRSLAEKRMSTMALEFDKVTLSDTRPVKPLKYEQVYPEEWTPNIEMRERYKKLFYKVKEWPQDTDESTLNENRSFNPRIDEIQVMLMSLIMLFSSDFLELDDSKLVSDIQAKYCLMLFRYLRTKYLHRHRQGKTMAVSKYIQGMYVSSMSREMKEIRDVSKIGREPGIRFGVEAI